MEMHHYQYDPSGEQIYGAEIDLTYGFQKEEVNRNENE